MNAFDWKMQELSVGIAARLHVMPYEVMNWITIGITALVIGGLLSVPLGISFYIARSLRKSEREGFRSVTETREHDRRRQEHADAQRRREAEAISRYREKRRRGR